MQAPRKITIGPCVPLHVTFPDNSLTLYLQPLRLTWEFASWLIARGCRVTARPVVLV